MSTTQQRRPATRADGDARATTDGDASATSTDGVPTSTSAGRGPTNRRRADALMVALSLGFTAVLVGGLWSDPNHRTFTINASDQALFEWMLAFTADAVRHGHDPFWTTLLNAPGGANLAVNTSETVLGCLLAPVTLLFGPSVSYLGAITFAIFATPVAWYLLLSRTVVERPAAAIVGALFCGFAPGLVSHANGHLNFASGYLVPLIVWRVAAMREPTRPGRRLRNGLIVGVLVAAGYSLGGETLFFAALGCAVVAACWLTAGHREPRSHVVAFGTGIAIAAGSAFVLLGYPLWMQFFGTGSFHGTGFSQSIHSEDLLAYGAFPARSVAGVLGLHGNLAINPTEENSFFGVPVLVAVIALAMLARRHAEAARRRLVTALIGATVIFVVLSLGPHLKVGGRQTWLPLPYLLLTDVPLFDSALPGRLALIVTTLAGVLLALGLDRLPAVRRPRLAAVATGLALATILPVPLLTMDRSGVPHFISSGRWRDYVRPGETLVPVPPASDWLPDGQRWQTAMLATGDGSTFRIPAGFFLGPGGPDGRGRIGPVPRPSFTLLHDVAILGQRPLTITPAMRAQARADVRYWGGNVIVMPAERGTGNRWHGHYALLLGVATELYGRPTLVDDVWLWRVS
ncbi:MAG: hypothetical protein QOE03_3661 [Micromonosporaceae bacterium]|nr:hypothetical protein [Micromonosporaceae bacterium]